MYKSLEHYPGPQLIEYNELNEITLEQYFLNGEKLTKDEHNLRKNHWELLNEKKAPNCY